MGRRVDSRDVLDPNGRTSSPFGGQILGHYRRTGPNAWDDYELIREEGGAIRVLAGLKIQLEKRGPVFRMRTQGKVVRVKWQPTDGQLRDVDGSSPKALRRAFLAAHVADFDEELGRGVAGVVASKLNK
jgi:hypothetical protein